VKRSVACILAATLAAALACSTGPRALPPQKLVIVGLDGLDPELTAHWIEEGKLPALAKLSSAGGLYRLETTPNPDTAMAWASFATGVNPGTHGIFDTIVRDPVTYAPRFALVERTPGRFLFNYIPVARPGAVSRRRGTSFWVTAGRAGVRSSILSVPGTFPPEEVPNGELLAGFPLPDISRHVGAYHYFASDIDAEDVGRSESGGMVQPLAFEADRARGELVGPPDPRGRDHHARELRVPFTLTWNRDARTASIEIGGETIHLLEGQWSRWVDVEFTINLLTTIRGMAQFYLASAERHLRLYVSPIEWHPAEPPVPISSPASLARDLHDRLGPFHTLGWPAAARALADGRLDDDAFLSAAERRFDDRAATILNRVDTQAWDLLVGVIDGIDHVQHVMWRLVDPVHPMYDPDLAQRHGNAIERFYRRADAFVEELRQRLGPDTTLMIVSAYGVGPFRTAVNLNSWLVERGYMTLRGPASTRETLYDLQDGKGFWDNVDWSKTRAYAVGRGQLFVNLAGREGHGIVAEGTEYEQLLDSLIIDLMNFLDPRTQDRIVANVFKRGEIYHGPFVHEAGDLLVTLENGYCISWQTALGGTPPVSVEANLGRWSGEHSSANHRTTAGVLITNRRVSTDTPRVIDIASTVLKHFGLDLPAGLDGVPFY
jgi:predicted AlkP superfamily phosphohydrolase/phosphomutase